MSQPAWQRFNRFFHSLFTEAPLGLCPDVGDERNSFVQGCLTDLIKYCNLTQQRVEDILKLQLPSGTDERLLTHKEREALETGWKDFSRNVFFKLFYFLACGSRQQMACTELGNWFKKMSKHSQQGIGRYRAGPMAWGPGRTTRQLQEAPYPFEIITATEYLTNCFAEGGGRLLHTFLQALAPRNITSTDDFQDKAWEKFNDWMFYFHPHLHDPNQAHPETSLGNNVITTDHWTYQQLLKEGFEVL
uniref:Uncharacterized protein n=1 Tax=Chromera velia CCMP2878 TaxID=1169474 RepID=A0A0G4HKS8_9ALVE|eukprot:Cvel_1136.t1-p1 / transcript=Cvel_1136.t1 / gene=Cvel_1136 / organism=Chromera_velia_CCMP2878 / gene_product=hypothetical protein / transcript_product=hypothetical protein / location=Cvel_scaffold37:120067-120801(+) / protein_length=245 / sequence_SO=supercontig / SO=protein_coding / is_pseudo=false